MPLYKVQFQFKLWNSSDVEPHSVITKHMHIDIALKHFGNTLF